MLKRLLIITCLAISGCGGDSETTEQPAKEEKPAKVTFTVVNKTGAKIISVGINSGDSRMTPMSYGSIDKSASETLKNKHLPSTVGLHWSKLNKERTSASIKISESLGATYQGPVTLTIKPNGKVSVSK